MTRSVSRECPTNQPAASPVRRYVLLALKIAVSVALLASSCSRGSTSEPLWASARGASLRVAGCRARRSTRSTCSPAPGDGIACSARRTSRSAGARRSARFSSRLFFNNFLPSNIGGDVIRIRDTAEAAQSKTLATTVVLVDRVHRADGARAGRGRGRDAAAGRVQPRRDPDLAVVAVGRVPRRGRGIGACRLRARRLRPPAAAADGLSSGVGRRAHREAHRRRSADSANSPGALAACFSGAVFVQATDGGVLLRRSRTRCT